MKVVVTSLVVLALSFGALGGNVRARSRALTGKEKCPSAQEVASSTVIVDGHEVLRQTFLCPETGALAQSKKLKGRTVARNPFDKRSAAECRTPAPECQCGTDFECFCFDFTDDAPDPSDCTILQEATTVVAQAEGATFLVDPDGFELITFQTCSLEWQNLDTSIHEYCWDDLSNTGGVVNQLCFEEGGGTAAECDADNDLWLSQSVRVGA